MEEWKKLVKQVRAISVLLTIYICLQIRAKKTPISRYKSLFDRLKMLSSLQSSQNFEPSYGEMADETAQRLLNDAQAVASFEESQKIVIYLINESSEYVRERFGVNSTEYAWELTKMLSVVKAFGLPSSEKAKRSVRRIVSLNYGEREAERLLSGEKLRDIFE